MHDDRKRRKELDFERQRRSEDREYDLRNRELKLQETKMAMDFNKLLIEK